MVRDMSPHQSDPLTDTLELPPIGAREGSSPGSIVALAALMLLAMLVVALGFGLVTR
jgi:hypothetical protein